jgi:hypothetical protein
MPKRGTASVARSSSSDGRQKTKVARLTHELNEALEREKATAEVLRVISSSPGELAPVFQSMLEAATRICEATSGNLFGFDGKAFYLRADLGTPPAFAEFARQPRIWGRDTALGQITRTKQTVHIVSGPTFAGPPAKSLPAGSPSPARSVLRQVGGCGLDLLPSLHLPMRSVAIDAAPTAARATRSTTTASASWRGATGKMVACRWQSC